MKILLASLVLIFHAVIGSSQTKLEPLDIYNLEYVSDPQVSPDGQTVLYHRNFFDIMSDGRKSNIWTVSVSGGESQPITTGLENHYGAHWSPKGDKIAFISNGSGKPEIWIKWLNGSLAQLTNLQKPPNNLSWSPDGQWIAFTMGVEMDQKPYISMPKKPKGAEWNDPAVVIKDLNYRNDGAGYRKPIYTQIFIISATGGTPIPLTEGAFNHGGPITWHPNGKHIIYASNPYDDLINHGNNTELYELEISSKKSEQITNRQGPDFAPTYAPGGKRLAYLGFDDEKLGYHNTAVYLREEGISKCLTNSLDRSVSSVQWLDDETLIIQYDDHGNTKLASMDLQGTVRPILDNVGGLSLGRPYAAGQFHTSGSTIAFTESTPTHPADLIITNPEGTVKHRISLNDDLLALRDLGVVEEINYSSSFDGKDIQGWICKPPNFDPSKKYPLLLEIHGGPFANYGDRFAMEVQLFAAAGYVVLYTNPRGSTSYGKDFANLIHHNYPNQDYDDLMSGVDAVADQGYIDEDRLYITGGSGGGVLTAWSIGKTDRFKAAVVAKPVINWSTFVLYADNYHYYYQYWFPGLPWEFEDQYKARSPLSLVQNVKTPTMLLTGESDFRTPIAETEQYYGALQLLGVESMMVRIPGASHGIASRPSNLISKVLHILQWFEDHP